MKLKRISLYGSSVILLYFVAAIGFRLYRFKYPEKFGNYLPKFNLQAVDPNDLAEVLNQEPTFLEIFFMPAERIFMFIVF